MEKMSASTKTPEGSFFSGKMMHCVINAEPGHSRRVMLANRLYASIHDTENIGE